MFDKKSSLKTVCTAQSHFLNICAWKEKTGLYVSLGVALSLSVNIVGQFPLLFFSVVFSSVFNK